MGFCLDKLAQMFCLGKENLEHGLMGQGKNAWVLRCLDQRGIMVSIYKHVTLNYDMPIYDISHIQSTSFGTFFSVYGC